jgi:hypothetical protein
MNTLETPTSLTETGTVPPITWDGTEANLLKDAKSLASLRQQYFGQTPNFKNDAEAKDFLRRRRIVGRVTFAAEQGLPTVQWAKPTYERERHVGRAATRANAIAKLKELIEGDSLETAPLRCCPSDTLIQDAILLTSENNILPVLLHEGRKRLAAYALTFWQEYEHVYPQERVEEIKLELANTAGLNAGMITELHTELQRLESSAADLIADAANSVVVSAFGPVREISEPLLDELIEVLEQRKAAAFVSEETFFQRFGLPHEQTTVSRRYEAVLKSVRDQRERIKNPQPHPTFRQPTHPAQTVIAGSPFGLEICPGVL